ncbi:MAG TPA: hypothetical protein VFQ38_11215 [Longimicrobiales bacterium]|nr:hypothetical protein [Longimicrobiales bacterium]
MSRAFVKEDAGDYEPPGRFGLPPADDPSYPAAAALALLEAARDGRTSSAEAATGYRWGDTSLRGHVQRFMEKELERPEPEQDARFIRVAKRFLSEG